MKVAVLGGGGFRTPIVHEALRSVAADADVESVVLHDVDGERLERIRSVIRGIDAESGPRFDVAATTSLEEAAEGAGAVLAAIRVGGVGARVIDEEVPLSLGVLGQETVGPGGIAFAIRTIPVMRRIGEVVRERAPAAWFVNFTNPAGMVTQAVRDVVGPRAVGICDSPAALCARVARRLGRRPASVRFDYAGLNHLGWLLGAEDEDGPDLLPELLAGEGASAIDEVRLFGAERVRALGAIPNEYLLYLDHAGAVTDAFRRDGARGAIVARQQRAFYEGPLPGPGEALAAWRAARDARHATYLAEARDLAPAGANAEATPDDGPGAWGYATVAADLLRALSTPDPARLILDVPNEGRLPDLGADEVVEVTCEVDPGGVQPLPGRPLPSKAAELVGRVKEVERLTLRAAETGSAAIALEAIAAHPVVPSRDTARRILDGYLARHDSLREALR
jgi:6-phospho-beta-glucosidase